MVPKVVPISGIPMLTDTAIRRWTPINNNERQRCGDGLYIRGFISGRKLFQLRQSINGKRRWIDIGDYPKRTLADAREVSLAIKRIMKSGEFSEDKLQAALLRTNTANELEAELVRGNDQNAGRLGIPTFDQAYREWYALQVKANRWTNLSSKRRPIRSYEIHIQKQFGNLRIDKIRRPMIKKLMQPLLLSNTEIATKLLGYLWEVFEEAFDSELIDSNPCPRIKSFTIPNKPVRHAASLHYSRLPELWNWLDSAPFSEAVKMAMGLSVVTVHRASVVANMRWKHFDCDKGIWTIPEKDIEASEVGFMKSGRQFSMKIPDGLSEALCALPRSCDHVFTVDGHRPINAETLRRNFQKFDAITTHGFRNTFKTWALNQNPPIDGFLVDRYCDHALTGLDKNYRRDDLFDQRAKLAERFLEHVGGKV
jgi:integrase